MASHTFIKNTPIFLQNDEHLYERKGNRTLNHMENSYFVFDFSRTCSILLL